MRILIAFVVLVMGGAGWWALQPEPEADLAAALARATAGAPPRETVASGASAAESAAEPSLQDGFTDDFSRLDHFAEIVDRDALEALQGRFARALADEPDNGELNLALCTSARLLGDPQAAVAFGDRAGALLPQSSVAHLEHAKALAELMRVEGVFSAMKHLGPYKDLIARAIKLDPGNVKARVAHIGFLVFAPGLIGGDLGEAQRLAQELAPLDARYSALMRVLALAQAERISEAQALCVETLADFPGDQSLHLTLARMFQEEGRGEEAVSHFQIVLGGPVTEKYYQALYHYGVLRIEAGLEHELALAAMVEYAEARPYGDFLPGVAAALWRQGQVYELMGNSGSARSRFEASLAEDPDFERAEDALAALD